MLNQKFTFAFPSGKNLLLLFAFLFSAQLITAQKNELVLTYHPVKDQFFGTGTSVSYYRHLYGKMAFGARTSVFGINDGASEYYDSNGKNVSIDVVNRWSFYDSKRFRFSTEVGISALNRSEQGHNFFFCGNSTPQEIRRMQALYGAKNVNYFGFTTALELEFKISKTLSFGAGYLLKAYRTNMEYLDDRTQYLSNLNLNLGVKF